MSPTRTLDRQTTEVTPRKWGDLLVVIAVALLGICGWWLVDEYAGIDHDIEVLVDDYLQAWANGDGEAVVVLMTPDGRHVSAGTPDDGYGGRDLVAFVDSIDTVYDFTIEPLGDPVIVVSDTGYRVVLPATGHTTGSGFHYFRVIEVDGHLLIDYHEWIG